MSSIVSQDTLTGPLDVAVVPPSNVVAGVTPSSYCRRKGFLDRLLAVTLLPVILPMIGATVAVMRITSKGRGIFRQVRVGLRGETYVMLKIRTMRENAEAATGPVWTQVGDSRITRMGHWIRALHLDEFPQIFNVLAGQMSLIGPRPERPEFTQRLAREIPGYLGRLAVRPGITGLAQINLPPDTDLDSVRRKIILDREYVEKATLWLDLRILVCTMLRMLGIRGLFPARLLGIYREVRLPTDEHSYRVENGNTAIAHANGTSQTNGKNANGAAPHEHKERSRSNDGWASPRRPR